MKMSTFSDMDVDSLPNEVLQQYIADFQTRLAAEKSNEILKLEKQKKELFDHLYCISS